MGKASRRKKKAFRLEPSPGKISTRLAQLVHPHVVANETLESYKALIILGATAWNLSLQPLQEREEQVREIVETSNAIAFPLTVAWMNELIARKLTLFPEDERFIMDFTVREESDGRFTVFVAASTGGGDG